MEFTEDLPNGDPQSNFYTTSVLPLIHTLEQQGLVTRTFRRLDPQRQMAVIQAILDEAGETGPAEINIRRVAERSGAAVGSLYQYFGSRAGLVRFAGELAVRATAVMFDAYRAALAEAPLAEAIGAYLQGGIEWSQQQVGLVRFFAAAAYHGDAQAAATVVAPIARSMQAMVREILVQAVGRGELRADLDVDGAARLLNAILIAVGDAQLIPALNTYYQLYTDDNSPQKVMEALLELIRRGWSPQETP